MDKLAKYREIVRKVISEYTTHKPYHGQIDVGAIIDSERDLPKAAAKLSLPSPTGRLGWNPSCTWLYSAYRHYW